MGAQQSSTDSTCDILKNEDNVRTANVNSHCLASSDIDRSINPQISIRAQSSNGMSQPDHPAECNGTSNMTQNQNNPVEAVIKQPETFQIQSPNSKTNCHPPPRTGALPKTLQEDLSWKAYGKSKVAPLPSQTQQEASSNTENGHTNEIAKDQDDPPADEPEEDPYRVRKMSIDVGNPNVLSNLDKKPAPSSISVEDKSPLRTKPLDACDEGTSSEMKCVQLRDVLDVEQLSESVLEHSARIHEIDASFLEDKEMRVLWIIARFLSKQRVAFTFIKKFHERGIGLDKGQSMLSYFLTQSLAALPKNAVEILSSDENREVDTIWMPYKDLAVPGKLASYFKTTKTYRRLLQALVKKYRGSVTQTPLA